MAGTDRKPEAKLEIAGPRPSMPKALFRGTL